MNIFKNGLAILWTILILTVLTGLFIWIKFIKNENNFTYKNSDHEYFCELAESREATESYLISNECK